MNEVLRSKIVSEINDDLGLNSLLNERMNELEELLEDVRVRKYIRISQEINSISKWLEENDSKEKIINYVFSKYCQANDCCHDILFFDSACFDMKSGFDYNKYVCLECGKIMRVEDYKLFEEKHTILKWDDVSISKRLVYNYYKKLYYQLLFSSNSVMEASNRLLKIFNEDKNTGIGRKLEK